VKEKVQELTGYQPARQILSFKKKELNDNQLLYQTEIKKGDKIVVYFLK